MALEIGLVGLGGYLPRISSLGRPKVSRHHLAVYWPLFQDLAL